MIFLKAALTFLLLGALSVNALNVPAARSPAPEPECEFPRLFSITSYHDLTMVSSTAQELRARAPPKITKAGIANTLTAVGTVAPVLGLFQSDHPKRKPEIEHLYARLHHLSQSRSFYDLSSRELQALGELFLREPED